MIETAARPYVPAPGGTLSRKLRDALLLLHGEYSSKVSSDMSTRLGFPVKMEAKSLDVVVGAKHQIDGAITVDFSISPGHGRGFAGVDAGVARALVDAAFSVPPRGSSAGGDISSVERKVTEGFMDLFLSRLNALWETMGECAFSPIKTDPSAEGKDAPGVGEETYVVVLFNVLLQGTASRLEAGLPLSFVKPLASGLEKPAEKSGSMADDPKLHPVLKRKMEGVLVPVRAFLAEPEVPLRDMADLEPGDVLNVGRLGAEAVLLAGTIPIFRGQAGVLNGHRAIRITSVAKNDRRPQ